MVPALTRPYPRAMQQPPGWGPQGYPPPQGYAPRPEHTFFQDNIVTVTNARAIIYGTTYALSNVTSVREWTILKSKWPIAFGVALALVSLPIMLGEIQAGIVIMLIAAGCFAFYFLLSKDRHIVRLGTASGEADALVSYDPVYVRTVVAALNNAIVHRG